MNENTSRGLNCNSVGRVFAYQASAQSSTLPKLGVMAHAYKPSTRELVDKGSEVQSHSLPHRKFKAYLCKTLLKEKKKGEERREVGDEGNKK